STSARDAAARPSTRVVGESLLVSFDADRGTLSIAVETDDPDTLAISTGYRIAATSPEPAPAAFAANLAVSVADVWRVGVRVEGEETGIRVALDDLPGWINIGNFSLDQAPSGEAILSIPVRWYGESTVDYDETVGADAEVCAATSTHIAVARVAAVD